MVLTESAGWDIVKRLGAPKNWRKKPLEKQLSVVRLKNYSNNVIRKLGVCLIIHNVTLKEENGRGGKAGY